MYEPENEQLLAGGAQTTGVVRVGATVRRPAHPRSIFVDELLRGLEAVGFDGASRALGYDARGRQVVSYVEGSVPRVSPFGLSDGQLRSAAGLVLRYHDATATLSLRGGQDVVCHGDLGPHNMVFRGNSAVALIDWDEVSPGRRAEDFAHAVWCCADLLEPAVPVTEQVRKAQLMCEAYPGMSPAIVKVELDTRFRHARDEHAAAGRTRAVEVFDQLLATLHARSDDLGSTSHFQ